MVIATPMGMTQETMIGCQGCIFNMGGENLKIDLVILDIQDFDVIIGIDFLSIHEDKIDCSNPVEGGLSFKVRIVRVKKIKA